MSWSRFLVLDYVIDFVWKVSACCCLLGVCSNGLNFCKLTWEVLRITLLAGDSVRVPVIKASNPQSLCDNFNVEAWFNHNIHVHKVTTVKQLYYLNIYCGNIKLSVRGNCCISHNYCTIFIFFIQSNISIQFSNNINWP